MRTQYGFVSIFLCAGLLLFGRPVNAQLNDSCTVSILNRTVTAQPDGTWVVPNIPSNQGRIRARATCVQNGATIFGQSDLFLVPSDGSVDVQPIHFGSISPIPDSVAISAPATSIQVGATLQLTTTGKYPDGTSANITAASTGTDYTSSVPQVASVSADGRLTGLSTGSTLVTAFNEGTQGFFVVTVGGGAPVITITSPANGATAIRGATLPVTVNVTNGTVSVIFLLADGAQVGFSSASPYQFSYQVPLTAGSIVLTAQAVDDAGNSETSQPVTISGIADPGTTTIGFVVDPLGNPISGAQVSCQGVSGGTTSNGHFSIAGVPTAQSSVVCSARFTNPSGVTLSGSSMRATAIARGTTDIGRITLGSLANRGTDFWMTLENNYPSGNGAQLTILSDATANFAVTAPGFSTTGTASASSPQTVILPASLQITANQTAQNRGIHLTSDAEISATLYYTSAEGLHDAYLALPTSSLDKEYFAASYVGGSSQFAVTAAMNNTNVAITPACRSVSGTQANTPFNILLNQGQTYQYACDTDVTGSHIVSNQPVSVVAGNGCAFIPAGSSSCDVTTEMMFPVSKLYGTDFYAVAFLDTAIRILAAKDGTSVTVDDGATVTTYSLNAGQFQEIQTSIVSGFGAYHITSDKPATVLQFGGQISNGGITFGGATSLQVLPTAAFKTQQALVPIFSGTSNFVIIVAPNSAVASLQLNGVAYPSTFTPLPGGQYQWTFAFPFLTSLSGPATFTADAPIAVYSTGFGFPPLGSFAYPVAF